MLTPIWLPPPPLVLSFIHIYVLLPVGHHMQEMIPFRALIFDECLVVSFPGQLCTGLALCLRCSLACPQFLLTKLDTHRRELLFSSWSSNIRAPRGIGWNPNTWKPKWFLFNEENYVGIWLTSKLHSVGFYFLPESRFSKLLVQITARVWWWRHWT